MRSFIIFVRLHRRLHRRVRRLLLRVHHRRRLRGRNRRRPHCEPRCYPCRPHRCRGKSLRRRETLLSTWWRRFRLTLRLSVRLTFTL